MWTLRQAQVPDASFGPSIAAGGALRYFGIPTPNARNADTSAVVGVAKAPAFSVARGFVATGSFNLVLTSADAGAAIYFTTDGSVPTANAAQRYVPAAGITVASAAPGAPVSVTVRAFAVAPNLLASQSVAHTYVFSSQLISQPAALAGFPDFAAINYSTQVGPRSRSLAMDAAALPTLAALASIPVLSLTAPMASTFGGASGYYDSWTPAMAAPVSIELLEAQGNVLSATGVAASAAGSAHAAGTAVGWAWSEMKRHLRVEITSEAGLDATLLATSPAWTHGGAAAGGAPVLSSFILRSGNQRSWARGRNVAAVMLGAEDAFVRAQHAAVGGALALRSAPVHLNLNGAYWGIYSAVEAPTQALAAARMGGDASAWFVATNADGMLLASFG